MMKKKKFSLRINEIITFLKKLEIRKDLKRYSKLSKFVLVLKSYRPFIPALDVTS